MSSKGDKADKKFPFTYDKKVEVKVSEPDKDLRFPKLEKPDRISVTFKENRSFELHIGNSITRFEGRETKILSKKVTEHKDFTDAMSKKFVIKEV